jgi:hypothetical protein
MIKLGSLDYKPKVLIIWPFNPAHLREKWVHPKSAIHAGTNHHAVTAVHAILYLIAAENVRG